MQQSYHWSHPDLNSHSNKSNGSIVISQNQLQGHFRTMILKGTDGKVVRENHWSSDFYIVLSLWILSYRLPYLEYHAPFFIENV